MPRDELVLTNATFGSDIIAPQQRRPSNVHWHGFDVNKAAVARSSINARPFFGSPVYPDLASQRSPMHSTDRCMHVASTPIC